MMSRGTVYLVDDDPSVRRSLLRLIAASGLEAVGFASSEEFLHAARAEGPSCLLLDLCLPGTSGLELQKALAPARPTMPVIFLSAHGSVPECATAMREGALDFIQKPVDQQVLLDAVEHALEISESAWHVEDDRKSIDGRLDCLTPREREVLALIVTGMLNKQIAYELGAAEKTIKVHRARVMRKMSARSVPDLVRMMHKLGIETARH